MTERWRRWLSAWPVITLIGLALIFVLMLVFSRKAPIISAIEPAMAAPGDRVVIRGEYFGRTEREGSLSLAGEIPPPSLIQSWSDEEVVFLVPEDAASGLVTVSNSQGTSTGVLFTNTRSIPTVLTQASAPGAPLIVSVVPAFPVAGQWFTVGGRGFGSGEQAVELVVSAGKNRPQWKFLPADTLDWSDRTITFRWPSGAGAGSTVTVTTPVATTSLTVDGASPVEWGTPRTVTVEVTLAATTSGEPLVLWAPVPQPLSGTDWTLVDSQPTPALTSGPLIYRWASGLPGERKAVYRLRLTTWDRQWLGPASGAPASNDLPRTDVALVAFWKPAQAALKALTARWGLETPDPWLRLQRLHDGIGAGFRVEPGVGSVIPTRSPSQVLASGTLSSFEAASLAAAVGATVGLPIRLVSGLWLGSGGPIPRIWAEAWVPGAAWVPWDVGISAPGLLDSSFIPFATSLWHPVRLEPRAKLLTESLLLGVGDPAGEALWTTQEPVVRWEIKRTEK